MTRRKIEKKRRKKEGSTDDSIMSSEDESLSRSLGNALEVINNPLIVDRENSLNISDLENVNRLKHSTPSVFELKNKFDVMNKKQNISPERVNHDMKEKSENFVFNYLNAEANHGIIINGFLLWMETQFLTSCVDDFFREALEYFDEDEIMEGKYALFQFSDANVIGKMPIRQGLNKKTSCLDDVITAMKKLMDTKKLPLIIGTTRMVLRTPLVPNKTDSQEGTINRRINKIEDSLENFIKTQSEQINRLSIVVEKICKEKSSNENGLDVEEVLNGRNNIPKNSTNFQPLNRGLRANVPQIHQDGRNIERNQGEDRISQLGSQMVENEMRQNDAQWSQPQTSKNSNKLYSHATQMPAKNIPEVVKSRRKPLLLGSASTSNGITTNIASDVSLVAYGVATDADENTLKMFLNGNGLPIVSCERLTTWAEARSHTYKITIKAKDYQIAMDPTVWPYRVGIRKFINYKQKTNSWNSQSTQRNNNG